MRKTPLLLLAFLVLVFVGAAATFLQTKSKPPVSSGFHASMYYFDNSDFFSASLKPFATTTPVTLRPRVFITNQHVLAASLIAHQFALARDPSVKRVILITQNNWDAGTAPIITSNEDWKTPLGNITTDSTLTDDLVEKHLASIDEDVFIHEHGITGIVPYVAYAFPNAKITVLVVRDKTPDTLLDNLAGELDKQMDANTVVVGTIDMSHYLPKYLADVHDQKTIEAVSHFDYDTLPRLDIDTAPTLRVVMKVADYVGDTTFTLTGHVNSADITSQPELLSTTSYITGYFSRGAIDISKKSVDILFTSETSQFSNIERILLGTDMVVSAASSTNTVLHGIHVCFLDRAAQLNPMPAAHACIDGGADVVINLHPHAPEPLEIYKGKAIFYSLNNFAVQLKSDGSQTHFTLVPLTIINKEASFSTPAEGDILLSAFVSRQLPKDVASAILNTYSFTTK